MPERTHKIVLILPLCLGLILLLTSTTQLVEGFWNYDTKRLLEIFFFPLAFSLALFYPPLRLAFARVVQQISPVHRWLLLAIVSVGIISALYHAESVRHGAYSILEVVLMSSLVVGALVLAAVRTLTGDTFDRLALGFILILGLAVGVQELVGAAAANSAGLEFNFRISLMNFSWPRFFNQVQSWTIPVLAALPALFWKRPLARILCVLVIGLNWYILLMTGARGTLVALVSAMALMLLLFPSIRRETATWHLSGLALGVAIYTVVLLSMAADTRPTASDFAQATQSTDSEARVAPNSAEPPTNPGQSSFYNQSLGRELLNTSGRWELWRISLDDIRGHPMLGAGPMNYACKGPINAAGHPHNFPLQVAGEWGLPAALALLFVLASLVLAVYRKLRTIQFESDLQQLLALLLAGGILTAFFHAGLSGVLVMPASQLAGMLICGWFTGLLLLSPDEVESVKSKVRTGKNLGARLLAVFLASSLCMLTFSIHEASLREENLKQTRIGDRLIPRYWQNGKMCGF